MSKLLVDKFWVVKDKTGHVYNWGQIFQLAGWGRLILYGDYTYLEINEEGKKNGLYTPGPYTIGGKSIGCDGAADPTPYGQICLLCESKNERGEVGTYGLTEFDLAEALQKAIIKVCKEGKLPKTEPLAVRGCMDKEALNYNPLATEDDGSCDYKKEVLGCMDPTATNYDPLATKDDGKCTYPPEPEPTPPVKPAPLGQGRSKIEGCDIVTPGGAKASFAEWMLENGFIDRIYKPLEGKLESVEISADGGTQKKDPADVIYQVANSRYDGRGDDKGAYGNLTPRGIKLYVPKEIATQVPLRSTGDPTVDKPNFKYSMHVAEWLYKTAYLLDTGILLERSPTGSIMFSKEGYLSDELEVMRDGVRWTSGEKIRTCGDLYGFVLSSQVARKSLNSVGQEVVRLVPYGFDHRARVEIEKILNGEPWDEYDLDEDFYIWPGSIGGLTGDRLPGPKPAQPPQGNPVGKRIA